MHRRHFLALGAGAAGSLAGCQMTKGRFSSDPSEDSPGTGEPTDGRSGGRKLASTVIGGTLNGHPRILADNVELIEESNTTWLHSFLDVRQKWKSGEVPTDDPDIDMLRRATTEHETNLIVNLMWDFKGTMGSKNKARVPEPGSMRETGLFEYATKLLEAIESAPDVIVLGNEPMWETPKKDIHGSDPAIVPFTRNLKAHLVDRYQPDSSKLLVGAFNRLHNNYLKRYFPHFRRGFFELARNDDDIDGIDLHVHYKAADEAEEMLTTAREEIPDGIITTTELSPAGRYNAHKDAPIGESRAGKRFANRYGLPRTMTVREYFDRAIENPRPRAEMADFYAAMPWYNVRFVEDMHTLLAKYDVSVATMLFMVGTGLANTNWPTNWMPFPINGLYQPPLLATEHGAHPHYLDDYRGRSDG